MSYDLPPGAQPIRVVQPTDWWEILSTCLCEAAVWATIDPGDDECDEMRLRMGWR